MGRSLKKGPYVDAKLLKRVMRRLEKDGKTKEPQQEAETGPDGPGPRTSACLQAIRLAGASEQWKRALEVAESGLKDRPTSIPLLVAKAEALVKLKRLSDAVEVYGRALAIDPDHKAATEGLIATQGLRRTQRFKRKKK